jgi:hypothetical protein
MDKSRPTKSEADELVNAKKIVTASVSWSLERGSWRLEVKAIEPNNQTIFRLVGVIGKTNHSFSLLYKNYSIRRFTKHSIHKFKDTIVTEPHKHVWDEKNGSSIVYIPSDINPNNNINEQFLAFCNECNIEILGSYQPVMYELIR